MENVIIIGIILILMFFGIRAFAKRARGEGNCCGGSKPVKQKKHLKKTIGEKVVIVEGMTCEHCSARVEDSINKIDGAAAEVNLKKGKAFVSMEKQIDDEEIRKAIENAGYKVVEIL